VPRGASPKREREYRELEERFKKEGGYKGRAKEVAARIVNKQRAQYGETKAEKEKDRRGQSPDRGLPIPNYQHKTVGEVRSKLRHLSERDLQQLSQYERQHKNRKTLLQDFDRAKKAA
jgi:hypothetical protein